MMENYSVFQPFFKSFRKPTGSDTILASKSEGFSGESIKSLVTLDNGPALK